MEQNKYYDGSKLISITKDRYGQKPEIFCVDGNRQSGKTTFFGRWFINRFKKHGEKFIIIKRWDNQLSTVVEKFWPVLHRLFFPNDCLTSEKRDGGAYYELFLNDEPCGYAISINGAAKVKENSHLLSDAKRMLFDEFQSDKYVPDEVSKLISIHTSIARGDYEFSRYCPLYMVCNHVSSLNPYYKAWHCATEVDELQEGFYKGDGFIIEKNMNYAAADAMKQSGFNRAFKNTSAVEHAINNTGINDNRNFIEKINTNGAEYVATCVVDQQKIALRRIRNTNGVAYYFDNNYDPSCKTKYAVSTQSHSAETVLINSKSIILLANLRRCFEAGYIRFSTLEVKAAAFDFMMIMM